MALIEAFNAPPAEHKAARHFNTIPLAQSVRFRQALATAYSDTRVHTEHLSAAVDAEHQSIQSMPDASPVKWHRAHTSWFFETFILQPHAKSFTWFDASYCYLFNSYYNAVGKQYPRPERGNISRPTAIEIGAYRHAVDERMLQLLEGVDDLILSELAPLLILGLNHEQQHQELILSDYQHARFLNRDLPVAWPDQAGSEQCPEPNWLELAGGLVETGYSGENFHFDNEGPRHKYWLEPFLLANRPVSNAEFLAFIEDGGYQNPLLWLADGWAWLQNNKIDKPLYWHCEGSEWWRSSHAATERIDFDQPLVNISFYEASAYANWCGARLPTEHEWEYAMSTGGARDQLYFTGTAEHKSPYLIPATATGLWLGNTWEWTASPYVAYPGFQPGAGAVGEYNGKFMSNQLVLKGYSGFTSSGHSRPTYRNFFYPNARWQQTGVRLAMDLVPVSR